jgi:hypothetical protein
MGKEVVYLTEEYEAARMIGCPVKDLREAVEKGLLECTRAGKYALYQTRDVLYIMSRLPPMPGLKEHRTAPFEKAMLR